MQEQANVSLSAVELQLVTDPGWILTKNGIIQKVYDLFGSLSASYEALAKELAVPEELLLVPPKISRGEQYKGLPYVMLDYPRCFGKEDVLAVRTFFWWGNYFSCTLHLKGRYLKQYAGVVEEAISNGELQGFYINTSNEEWNHDVNESMQPITIADKRKPVQEDLIKISGICSLQQWNEAADVLRQQFQLYLKLMKS
jgi:hypothetical protein